LPFYRYTFKTFFNSDPGSGNTDEALALISDATFNSQCIGAIIQPYYNETRSTYIGNITGGLSLMLGTNYNPNIFIDGSTNHVGIGTTEPEQPLDVAGIAQAYRLRSITTGTGPNDGYVDIGRADKFWSIKQRNANGGGTDDLRFQNSDNGTWGPVILNLKTNGKVGIGTTEPEQPLDVAGIAQAHRLRAITAGTGPNDGYVDIGRADKFWSIKQRNANGGGTDDLRFQNSDNGKWGPVILNLKTNGKVGIGTTEPEQPLDVAGIAQAHRLRSITTGTGPNDGHVDIGRADKFWSIKQRNANGGGTDDLRFQNSDNGTWGPVILNLKTNGRVGIGTESPNATLEINQTTNAKLRLNTTSGDKGIEFSQGGNRQYEINANANSLNIGVQTGGNFKVPFRIHNSGQVIINDGIPIPASTYQNAELCVNGTGAFREVVVLPNNEWPDYVFEKEYQLPDLSELEQYIIKNKHLPGVPKADVVTKQGIELGEMNRILLQKVEELTLLLIK
jgi:hypothetical protein